MVTKDKNQICYIHHISSSMKNHGCESFNVLVDLPEVKKYHVNSIKTNHSKLDWNKLYTVLNRSTFDSTVKMLELNTDNKITFFVEMMKANLLLTMCEPINSIIVFTTRLNELDLIKLQLLNKEELNGIVEGNFKMYNDRIEDRLSCKVCRLYESPDDGGVSFSRLFKCTHFFYPKCVTAWNFSV